MEYGLILTSGDPKYNRAAPLGKGHMIREIIGDAQPSYNLVLGVVPD